MRRIVWFRLLVLALLVLPQGVSAANWANPWPDIIPLPNGYQPDLRTGQGSLLVPPRAGRAALGMTFDERSGYLFVAGGDTGKAFVYEAATGALAAEYQLAEQPGALVNDVALTNDAVYFTDSFNPVFYRLPLLAGGRLPGAGAIERVPLP